MLLKKHLQEISDIRLGGVLTFLLKGADGSTNRAIPDGLFPYLGLIAQ